MLTINNIKVRDFLMKNFTKIKLISLAFLFGASLLLLNNCRGGDNRGSQQEAEAKPKDTGDSTAPQKPCEQKSVAELMEHCSLTPEWLKTAQTSEAVISILSNGYLKWHKGIWENGTWEKGTWHKGIWKNGIWQDGVWKNGIWHKGVWEQGTWLNGTWKIGFWHNGIWHQGTWENGFWKNGTWNRGFWKGGSWKGQLKGSDFNPAKLN